MEPNTIANFSLLTYDKFFLSNAYNKDLPEDILKEIDEKIQNVQPLVFKDEIITTEIYYDKTKLIGLTIQALPEEILEQIFAHLEFKDLVNISKLCKQFFRIVTQKLAPEHIDWFAKIMKTFEDSCFTGS